MVMSALTAPVVSVPVKEYERQSEESVRAGEELSHVRPRVTALKVPAVVTEKTLMANGVIVATEAILATSP